MNPMPDPAIDEIREIRHRISAMCDHDPAKLVAYFQKLQEQHVNRVITSPQSAPPDSGQQVNALGADDVVISQPSIPVS